MNTGGRYDPVGNTWAQVTTAGAPSGRYLHTAVWTGSRMIVWGGYSGVALADGGRYDPVADAWQGVAASGAPTPRYNHTSIFGSGRMIVWGGTDGFTVAGAGGRYDPVGDQWSPMSTGGAPAARQLQTAVWTGLEMIVWGGQDDVSSLATGGRYDPQADSWSSTALGGAPVARYDHSAVWTGGFMIVWGGQNEASALITGGRYALGQTADHDLDGYTPCTGDCDDFNPAVHPGAPEVCDGVLNDCDAAGWPSIAGTMEADDDGDGLSECAGDCDDTNAAVWEVPSEVPDLEATGGVALSWAAPLVPGGSLVRYDVLRTAASGDWTGGAVCIESDDSSDLGAFDGTSPPQNTIFYYLVRAENACPGGSGPLGWTSGGIQRQGRSCP